MGRCIRTAILSAGVSCCLAQELCATPPEDPHRQVPTALGKSAKDSEADAIVLLKNELSSALKNNAVKILPENIHYYDGGSFGFLLRGGTQNVGVFFLHPAHWNAEQKKRNLLVVLIGGSSDINQAMDITARSDVKDVIFRYLKRNGPDVSLWHFSCACLALQDRMIWTKSGRLIIPKGVLIELPGDELKSIQSEPLLHFNG